jgi:hypothetical protein
VHESGIGRPEPIRRHVRSWRKRTLHRHRNVVRKGQRIAELEANIETLQRQALALGAAASVDSPLWVLLRVKIAASKRSRAA